MEGRNKKDMSVDELVKQLKLVLDIDETEDDVKPPVKTADTDAEEETTAPKSVGESSGTDIGEELEKLFEEEESKKKKKKKRLFGKTKKEKEEQTETYTEPEPEKTEEEPPVTMSEPEPEEKDEKPKETENGETDGWITDALTGLFSEDGERTDGLSPETEATAPAPEEEKAYEPEAETAKEELPEQEPSAISVSDAEDIADEAEEENAPPVLQQPEEEPEKTEEPAVIPEGSTYGPEEEREDDTVIAKADEVEDEPEETDEDVKTYEADAEPFVSDVFGKAKENADDEKTIAICPPEEVDKTIAICPPEEDGDKTIAICPKEEADETKRLDLQDGDETKKIVKPGEKEAADTIDEDLISDIERFDAIFSDKDDEDGYSTADEAIMDAFAEKPKQKKKSRKIYTEENDEIFTTMTETPVGGRTSDDGEEEQTAYTDEFTSYDQRKIFLEDFKKKYASYKKSLIFSSFFALLLFIYELLPLFVKELPYAFNRTENPAVFTLVGLVLFSLCAAFSAKYTFEGFRSVFKGNTTLSSMVFLVVLFTYIYGVIIAVKGDVILYPMMSVSALSVISMLAAEMHIIKRRTLAFRIISGSPVKNKYVLERYQLGEDRSQGSAIGVSKAAFISRFNSSGMKKSNADGYLNLLFPATALIFILFFAGGLLIKKDVSYAASYGFAAGIFCMPAAIFTALSFPSYICSKKAYGDGSCVISDAEAEKYASASAVLFEDSDVFPPSHDKITSVRLYNDSRMDHIMYIMMSVFGKLGGPLYTICENAAKEYGSSPDVEIVNTAENGVEARVDSLAVRIGSADYLGAALDRSYREDDGMYETNGAERIMYMTVNGTVSAKFYIEYGMDPEFRKIIKQLSGATRTVAIRTLDPNIDNDLLAAFIDPEIYNCRVVAGKAKNNEVKEESCGSIVSKSSVKSLMRTLLLCDKTVYTSKINILICFLSMIIGLLITVFLIITGSLNVINVLYAAAYQLIITAVVRIITRLHI